MNISNCLKLYLDRHHISYQLVSHRFTDTAFNAAKSAHITAACMVKGVLLHDDKGYLMAAISANKDIDLENVNTRLRRKLSLVEENTLVCILNDCKKGAVPALGEAFGIPTIWDKDLVYQPGFYIEAGNHEDLIRLSYFDFMALMGRPLNSSITH